MNTPVILPDEPKGWRALQNKARREKDPGKLAVLIDQLNRLVDKHEELAAKRDAQKFMLVDRDL